MAYTVFTQEEMEKIVALLQWMNACNAANVADAFDPAIKKPLPPFFNTPPTNGVADQPPLSYYHHAMRFVAAANEHYVEEKGTALNLNGQTTFTPSVTINSAQPTKNPGKIELKSDTDSLALANDLADTFNQFRKNGHFEAMEEAAAKGTEDQKKELHAIQLSHDYALNLRGGTASTLIKAIRRLVKLTLVTIGYPFLAFVWGGLSLVLSALHTIGLIDLNRWRAVAWINPYARYLAYLGIFSSFNQGPLFTKGFKYLQEAGLKEFSSWEEIRTSASTLYANLNFSTVGDGLYSIGKMVNFIVTGVLSLASIGVGTLAEGAVKMLLFPFRWALEYDQMSSVNQARFDDLENMLVGFLMSPFIIVNHAYASLKKSVTNLFAAPKDDPVLIAWNARSWAPNFLKLGHYDNSNQFVPDLNDRTPLAVFLKITHFAFDTLPDMFASTLVGTLRSIFPAVSLGGSVTKEMRDTGWGYVQQGIYWSAFAFQALLLGWGIAVACGASGTILALVWSEFLGGMGVAYTWLATQAWQVPVSVFSAVASYFGMSHTFIGGLADFELTAKTAKILKVLGSVLGSVVVTIAGFFAYDLYEQSQRNKTAGKIIVPDVPGVSKHEALELKKLNPSTELRLKEPTTTVLNAAPSAGTQDDPSKKEKSKFSFGSK